MSKFLCPKCQRQVPSLFVVAKEPICQDCVPDKDRKRYPKWKKGQ